MKNKLKNLLIISAHADDNIGCAGTVFKLQNEFGFRAFEVVYTNSTLGQNYKKSVEIAAQRVAKTRVRELVKAQKFLGIVKSFNFNQPDLGLVPSQDLVFKTMAVIREVRPEIVFLMNAYDSHPDHKQAFEIGLTAVKIAATGVLRETLGKPFRVPMVLCSEGMLPIPTQISVDVTAYCAKKDKLFRLYVSQASPKALKFDASLGFVRGYHLRKEGRDFAEAFTLPGEFPVLMFEK